MYYYLSLERVSHDITIHVVSFLLFCVVSFALKSKLNLKNEKQTLKLKIYPKI